MRGFDQEEFLGTRCNLFPWSDGGAMAGWIVAIKDSSIILRTHDTRDVENITGIRAEAFGRESMAVFHVTIEAAVPVEAADESIELCEAAEFSVVQGTASLGAGPKHLELSIQGSIQHLASDTKCRVLAQNLFAFLTLADGMVQATVLDVSESGIGLATRIKLSKGERVQMQVKTESEKIELEGDAMYCTPIPGSDTNFRAGIKLALDDRATLTKWVRLVRATQNLSSSSNRESA